MEEHRAKKFHSVGFRGKLRTVVWWVTHREKGGVAKTGDACSSTGEPVIDVLRFKNLRPVLPWTEVLTPTPTDLQNWSLLN